MSAQKVQPGARSRGRCEGTGTGTHTALLDLGDWAFFTRPTANFTASPSASMVTVLALARPEHQGNTRSTYGCHNGAHSCDITRSWRWPGLSATPTHAGRTARTAVTVRPRRSRGHWDLTRSCRGLLQCSFCYAHPVPSGEAVAWALPTRPAPGGAGRCWSRRAQGAGWCLAGAATCGLAAACRSPPPLRIQLAAARLWKTNAFVPEAHRSAGNRRRWGLTRRAAQLSPSSMS